MAIVGAAAMAVVGIGGATSVDAQTDEECHSVKVINGGTAAFDNGVWSVTSNIGDMLVCEFGGTYAPGNVMAPAGLSGPTENCVEFPTGSTVGAVTYLVLTSAESSIVAVQDHGDFTGIGLWTFEPGGEELEFKVEAASSFTDCGGTGYSVPPHEVSHGDVVWVGSSYSC